MAYDTWPRWVNLQGAVPCIPAPPATRGMSLRYADEQRSLVWREYPYNVRKGATDWDPLSRGYPPDPTGVCRHRVSWLQQRLGGTPLYGRRTDKPAEPMHCVLWLRVGNYGFIVDHDGIWPEQSAPFVARLAQGVQAMSDWQPLRDHLREHFAAQLDDHIRNDRDPQARALLAFHRDRALDLLVDHAELVLLRQAMAEQEEPTPQRRDKNPLPKAKGVLPQLAALNGHKRTVRVQ